MKREYIEDTEIYGDCKPELAKGHTDTHSDIDIKESFNALDNFWDSNEMRRRVLVTLGLLAVYRLGLFIPIPGVDEAALNISFVQTGKSVLDTLPEGASEHLSIFSLGIMPYFSATIIFQFLMVVSTKLREIQKGNPWKIAQYVKYTAVLLSIMQAFGVALMLKGTKISGGASVLLIPTPIFTLTTILTLTTGTLFLIYLAEQISKNGIGSGLSLLCLAGIVSPIPGDILSAVLRIRIGELDGTVFLFPLLVIIAIIGVIVALSQGKLKIPVQYVGAERNSSLSFQVTLFGVGGISLAALFIPNPAILLTFWGAQQNTFWRLMCQQLAPGGAVYSLLEIALIVFFAYLWALVVINPEDIAETMKKYGGFIPQVGENHSPTDYIEKTLVRVVLVGGVAIALINLVPDLVIRTFHLPFYFSGRSLLFTTAITLYIWLEIKDRLMFKELEEVFVHYQNDEVIVVRGLLEGHGIKTTLSGEAYGRMLGFSVGLFGEKRLLVKKEDYPKSMEIIQQHYKESEEFGLTSDPNQDQIDVHHIGHCRAGDKEIT